MYNITSKIRFLLLILFLSLSPFAVTKNNNRMSLEEASDHIRQSTNGKVLSARTIGTDHLKSHRIQVLTTSGRVKVYMVPAYNKNKRTDKKNINQYHYNDQDKQIDSNRKNHRLKSPNYQPKRDRQQRSAKRKPKRRSSSQNKTQSQRDSKQK